MAGEVRARDVRFKLKGRVDPALLDILENLAEQQHNLAKNQGTMATMIDQLADIVTGFVAVAENMKKRVLDNDKDKEAQDMLDHAEKKKIQ